MFYHLWPAEYSENMFLPLGFILSSTVYTSLFRKIRGDLGPEQHLPGTGAPQGALTQPCRPCTPRWPTLGALFSLYCAGILLQPASCSWIYTAYLKGTQRFNVRPAGYIPVTRKITLQDKSSFKTFMQKSTMALMTENLGFKVIWWCGSRQTELHLQTPTSCSIAGSKQPLL